jgi:hypothetical protein
LVCEHNSTFVPSLSCDTSLTFVPSFVTILFSSSSSSYDDSEDENTPPPTHLHPNESIEHEPAPAPLLPKWVCSTQEVVSDLVGDPSYQH